VRGKKGVVAEMAQDAAGEGEEKEELTASSVAKRDTGLTNALGKERNRVTKVVLLFIVLKKIMTVLKSAAR